MMIRTRIFEGSGLYYRMVIDRGENQLHVMVHKCWSKDRRYFCYRMQLYNGHSISDIILRNYTTKSMIQFKLPCWHYVLFFSPMSLLSLQGDLNHLTSQTSHHCLCKNQYLHCQPPICHFFFLNNLHMSIILLAM